MKKVINYLLAIYVIAMSCLAVYIFIQQSGQSQDFLFYSVIAWFVLCLSIGVINLVRPSKYFIALIVIALLYTTYLGFAYYGLRNTAKVDYVRVQECERACKYGEPCLCNPL